MENANMKAFIVTIILFFSACELHEINRELKLINHNIYQKEEK